MHYWLIDVKPKKATRWEAWALMRGGKLHDHLPIVHRLPTILEGAAEEFRIRVISEKEAAQRVSLGTKMLSKKEGC
jgi:hypothetical protein